MKQPVGAGGTEGGTGRFFIGLVMLVAGGYLFLNNIHVGHNIRFGFGHSLFHVGGFGITSGFVLIPFIFGIGFIFYNYKNIIGWILAGGSLLMLGFGVITSINFTFRPMSAFELIMILILLVGGIGLFLSSLKGLSTSTDDNE
ncbi:MAG: hypothetical protein JEY94_05220 [Melioribacteraceae bacterium]|nr:hypothetical protein [Melioribacteraceae bacterium]